MAAEVTLLLRLLTIRVHDTIEIRNMMVPATQRKILTAILLKLGKKPHPVTQDDS